MGINKSGQSGERRIMKLAAVGDFLLIESGIVMPGSGLYSVMLRGESLNDNSAPGDAPPSPAGDLT